LLVHHQKTIEDLMGIGFTMIIPMQLGTIVSSKDEVLKILTNGYSLIIDTLRKIEHLTEIDIAVTWADFPGILREIAGDPEIQAMKNDILNRPGTDLKMDQMKVGMLVHSKLKEKNKKVELNILDLLSSISVDTRTHEVMNDEMITNSAFLINRNKKEEFEQVIDRIDEENKGLLNFKLVGPLPCYSFFTIEFKELNPEGVEQARLVLGLRDEITESEMKKAYLEKARLFHPDSPQEKGDVDNFNRITSAYHTLLDFTAVARQKSNDEYISFAKENVVENLVLVKIKE